tara:strand:- start:639 stop:809 length:171 start_codon:yes stop_codon:yes gene_type:complete
LGLSDLEYPATHRIPITDSTEFVYQVYIVIDKTLGRRYLTIRGVDFYKMAYSFDLK